MMGGDGGGGGGGEEAVEHGGGEGGRDGGTTILYYIQYQGLPVFQCVWLMRVFVAAGIQWKVHQQD